MKQIKAAIFDRDGVLSTFDMERAGAYLESLLPDLTLTDLENHWNDWGPENGFPSSLELEDLFFEDFWESVGERYGVNVDRIRSMDYTDYLTLYPEVLATFMLLKRKGIKIGVLTNFPLASVNESLLKLKIDQYVDLACASTVMGVRKPEREAYHTVLRILEAQPHEVLYFDDTPEHVAGALQAGIIYAFLVDRDRSEHDLQNHVVHDLSGISDVLMFVDKHAPRD